MAGKFGYDGAPTVSSDGGMLAANNLSDLTDASAGRSNLGLGTAATHPSTDFDAAGAAATAQTAAQGYADTKVAAEVTRANAAYDAAGAAATAQAGAQSFATSAVATQHTADVSLFAAATHATQHEAGGSDVVPLQLISAPAVSTPAAPAAGNAIAYVKSTVGRERLHQISALFAPTHVGDALYAKSWNIVTAGGAGRRESGYGSGSASTLTAVAAVAGASGHGILSQGATSGSANATSSVGSYGGTGFTVFRGAVGDPFAGFFYRAAILCPDASYNNTGASTGSRLISGVSGSSTALTSDHGGANHVAIFSRCNVNGGTTDTNWQFVTNNASGSPTVTDTGMALTQNHLYETSIACPVGGTTIYWQITDLTAGTTQSGSVGTTLPGATTGLISIAGVGSVDAVVRNIQFSYVYLESDKG